MSNFWVRNPSFLYFFLTIFKCFYLRAPWTDFKFPKTAHTYVFRTFHLIFFLGVTLLLRNCYLHDPEAQFQFIYHYESTILWLCCTVFIITKTSFIHDISRKYESFCFEEVSMLLCIILGWSQVNFRICYWILRELDTTSPFKEQNPNGCFVMKRHYAWTLHKLCSIKVSVQHPKDKQYIFQE